MTEKTTVVSEDGRRRWGGSLRLHGPRISRLAISVDGALDDGVVEDLTVLDTRPPLSRSASPGYFGVLPSVDLEIPGGAMFATPSGRKGSYRRYENAYVRVSVAIRSFLPTLRIEFKPYTLLALDPHGLEATRAAVSGRFLAQEREVKISRLGLAVDLSGIGFVPPRRSEVVTRARRVENPADPLLASPTFGSPSGGVTFSMYDHTALRSTEEDWLSARPRPRYAPPKGMRSWRAELTYYRPAIRRLGLDGDEARRGIVIETVPALANSSVDLLAPTLDADDPWVRIVHEPTESMPPGVADPAWWGAVREAFLEGAKGVSAEPMVPVTAYGAGRSISYPLGRLATLLSPGRR